MKSLGIYFICIFLGMSLFISGCRTVPNEVTLISVNHGPSYISPTVADGILDAVELPISIEMTRRTALYGFEIIVADTEENTVYTTLILPTDRTGAADHSQMGRHVYRRRPRSRRRV